MVEPTIDDSHEGDLIYVAEKMWVDEFYVLLVEDPVHQRESVFVHELKNAFVAGAAFDLCAHF